MEKEVAKAALEAAENTTRSAAGLIERILGPTADYWGHELASYFQKRRDNAERIATIASEKLGDRINEPGRVPPKVIKEIMEEGTWADDELALEYFGGVLASSRTGVPRDDRAAVMARMVAQMTTYQIRAHYIFYCLIKGTWDKKLCSNENAPPPYFRSIYLSYGQFLLAMGTYEGEDDETIIQDAYSGLVQLGLINQFSRHASAEMLTKKVPEATDAGLIITPSPQGVALYMNAQGLGHLPNRSYFDPEQSIEMAPHFIVFGNIYGVKNP